MTDELNNNADMDDVFVAEADEFDDNLDAELPGWPKVVGVISIVWGVVGIICNGLGVASAFLTPMLVAGAGEVPPVVSDPPITSLIASVLGVLLAVLLLVAGVMTVSRKAAGRTAHLIYAPVNLLLIIWAVMVQLKVQGEIAQWVNDNPDTTFAQQQQMGGSIGMIIMFVFTAIFLIWPVFCLVWFGAIKRTHHDMTGGVDLDTI